jgi:hypothetical protein
MTRPISSCALVLLCACASPVTVAELDPTLWGLSLAPGQAPNEVVVILTLGEVCDSLDDQVRATLAGVPLHLSRDGRTATVSSGPPIAGLPMPLCVPAQFASVVNARLLDSDDVVLAVFDGKDELVLRGGPLVVSSNVRAGPLPHPYLLPPVALALPIELERGGPLHVFFEREGGEVDVLDFYLGDGASVWLAPTDGVFDVEPVAAVRAEGETARAVPASVPLGEVRIDVMTVTGIPTDVSGDGYGLCTDDHCLRAPRVVVASRVARVEACAVDDCAPLADERSPCVLYGTSWEDHEEGCTIAFSVLEDCAWSDPGLRCSSLATDGSMTCTCLVDGEEGDAFTIWADFCTPDFAISGIASAMCPYVFGGYIPIVR